ncbi:unnamed protein product, partial [Mesorhabditis spiculigera]
MKVENSRFYLDETEMSSEEQEKGPMKHFRRLSDFLHNYNKAECASCAKVQLENERLETVLQMKMAEYHLMEKAMNRVKEAYVEACLEISELKQQLEAMKKQQDDCESSNSTLSKSYSESSL